jgi:hypothetical protein
MKRTPLDNLFGDGQARRRFEMQAYCNAYGKPCLLPQAGPDKNHPACGTNGGPYGCASCLRP